MSFVKLYLIIIVKLFLDQKLSYLGNFTSSVLYIPYIPYQKSRWKVQVNVMTPQELGVC